MQRWKELPSIDVMIRKENTHPTTDGLTSLCLLTPSIRVSNLLFVNRHSISQDVARFSYVIKLFPHPGHVVTYTKKVACEASVSVEFSALKTRFPYFWTRANWGESENTEVQLIECFMIRNVSFVACCK